MVKGCKIVMIISPFARPNLGGVESHLDRLISYCIKRGYYPVLLTYQPLTRKARGLPHEFREGYEIHRMPWFGKNLFNNLEKYFLFQFLYLTPGLLVFSFYYYLRYYDSIICVHAHGLAAGFITRVLAQIHRKRSVISTHAIYNFKQRRVLAYLVKYMLFGFDVVLAVSKVSRQELLEIGLPANKVMVYSNWTDVAIFKPLAGKISCFDKPVDYKLHLLYVGRLINLKGVHLILDVAKRANDTAFHIVGGGPLTAEVENEARFLKNIIYHGVLMQDREEDLEKLVALYNCCDYLLSPYLYDEGFSITLIESIACGSKVIVPNRGSPPTFLNDSVAVYLDKNVSVGNIIDTIKSLTPKNETSVLICQDFAQENFGFKNADVIVDTYEREL